MSSFLKGVIAALGLYLAVLIGILVLMVQPPARFAKGISMLPGAVTFTLIPFQRLWSFARAGNLEVGSPAPDFHLPTVDQKSHVRLSSFRGDRPVVLVFGSYT